MFVPPQNISEGLLLVVSFVVTTFLLPIESSHFRDECSASRAEVAKVTPEADGKLASRSAPAQFYRALRLGPASRARDVPLREATVARLVA